MGWKSINGRQYFYEATEVDGDRVVISWGSGCEAKNASARVEHEREEKALDLELLRVWRERDRITDSMVNEWEQVVKKAIDSRLEGSGFHQHNGQWRKRRKFRHRTYEPSNIQNLRDSIMERKKKAQSPLVKSELEDEIRQRSIDTLHQMGFDDAMIAKTSEQMIEKIETIRTDFGIEKAVSFERLLIEQIATAWVQWFIANLLIDSQSMASRTWRQNQYLELRFNRCQNRLTKSIDQLARVRCVPRKYLEDGRMQV